VRSDVNDRQRLGPGPVGKAQVKRRGAACALLLGVLFGATSGRAQAPATISLDPVPTTNTTAAPAPAARGLSGQKTSAAAPAIQDSQGVQLGQPGVALSTSVPMPPAGEAPKQARKRGAAAPPGAASKPAKRDPLQPDLDLALKDTPARALDLPGVMKLDGVPADVLDSSRARKIRWTNEGSQTVWLSVTDPNRIQLPFPNPRVVSTTDVDVDKRPGSSNVYVTFASGVTRPVQIWFEPQVGSSASIGLQLVPKRIPAQTIIVTDDTGGLAPRTPTHATSTSDDFLAQAQGSLQDALTGGMPAGWAAVNLTVPPIALDGVLVSGARRLSSQSEDIYVYEVKNPTTADRVLDETQFDGPLVEAVSIYPSPLVQPGRTVKVGVLVRKGHGSESGAQ